MSSEDVASIKEVTREAWVCSRVQAVPATLTLKVIPTSEEMRRDSIWVSYLKCEKALLSPNYDFIVYYSSSAK
jgi:hypothetical protein